MGFLVSGSQCYAEFLMIHLLNFYFFQNEVFEGFLVCDGRFYQTGVEFAPSICAELEKVVASLIGVVSVVVRMCHFLQLRCFD